MIKMASSVWKIDLNGEAKEILDLKQLAPCCDCALVAAPDAQYCLGGAAFDQVTSADEMRAKAEHVLTLLNGLARLERVEHRPVHIGEQIYGLQGNGAPWRYPTHAPRDARPRSMVWEFAPPGFHSSDSPTVKDSGFERRKRIVSDPALAEILAAIADEITWQRLRVAFEKICAVVSKSTTAGRWDNAMVKHGYASQGELNKFKENVQDPRHSGIDAVHGVPEKSPLKSTKMTEKEGFEFVVRLLNTYVDRNPKG
jgi:hypothetical protein